MIEWQFKLWILQAAAQSCCLLQTHSKRNQWGDLRMFLSDLAEKKKKSACPSLLSILMLNTMTKGNLEGKGLFHLMLHNPS